MSAPQPRTSSSKSGAPVLRRQQSTTPCWYDEPAATKSTLPGMLCDVRERLQGKLGAVDFPMPKFALIGGTGVGKSRLLDCLAGREVSYCAGSRRPTVLEFRNVKMAKEPKWYIREDETKPWELCPVADIKRAVASAHTRLKDPISLEPVSIRVESDACFDMQVVDLPGYRGPAEADADAAELVESLNDKYLWDPRTVILCVEEAGEGEFAALARAQRCDPGCQRTLLVRTKLDLYYHSLSSENVNRWVEGSGKLPQHLPKFTMTLPFAAAYEMHTKRFGDLIRESDAEDITKVESLGLSKMFKAMVGFRQFEAYLGRRVDRIFSEAIDTVMAKLQDIEACAGQRRAELREELDSAADPAKVEHTVHLCGLSFASCLTHVMEGHIKSNVKRVTLAEELHAFHAYHTELGDLDTFMCIPSVYFEDLKDYVDYLRYEVRVPTAEVAINGGAQFSRLLYEVEVFLRFDEIDAETRKRDVMQAFGVSTGRSVTWKEVVVKMLTHSMHVQLQKRIRYVGERIKWFFQQQKEPVVHFMESLKGSPDEKTYSTLYTKHASLIEDNVTIRNLVLDAYDNVVDRQCRHFLGIFQSTLYAIFANPWVYLKKTTAKPGDLDPDDHVLLPSIEETKARLQRELDDRSGGERDLAARIYKIPLEPHRIDESVELVQGLVSKVYTRIRRQLCDQVELFAESFFKLPLMRCLEEDMVKIRLSPIDEEGYRLQRDRLQARLAEAERELSEVQDCLRIIRNFTLTSVRSA